MGTEAKVKRLTRQLNSGASTESPIPLNRMGRRISARAAANWAEKHRKADGEPLPPVLYRYPVWRQRVNYGPADIPALKALGSCPGVQRQRDRQPVEVPQ